MSCLGNLIWMLCCGIVSCISWFFAGCLCCITIIGIPVGLQCFKIATLSLAPFGREVQYSAQPTSLLLNIIWIVFLGWELFLIHLGSCVLLCITIIGIPFAAQSWKLAKLSLFPFGAVII